MWTGRELVAWDDRLTAAAVEVVSGRWRTLPDIPSIPGFCDPAGVRAGDVVFAELCGRGAIYDPAEGRWRPTTHPYFLSGQPVWTGRRLLWWTALNLSGRHRARLMGTFGVSVYAGLGAASLHPLSVLTTSRVAPK